MKTFNNFVAKRSDQKKRPEGRYGTTPVRRREEEPVESQKTPKTFRPMMTMSGTPHSQRMMLFMKVSVCW
ncbi:hypothetical protein RCH10_003934 [Variovorax sp. GrIS 2.14]